MLCEIPSIQHAVIYGNGKPYIGAILSPSPTTDLPAEKLIEMIWPEIESINSRVYEYSRIPRHAIIIEEGGKKFLYTDKGTVRAQAVRELYKDEIENVYNGR